jgi:high mobility group protein B2
LKDKERYNEEMQHYVSVDDDTGRKRAKKDPNAPKRNMSAYFLFSIAARPAYKKAYPDASFGDLAKIIGQAYKSLPDHEKQQWVKKAEHDKIRYQNELASYG